MKIEGPHIIPKSSLEKTVGKYEGDVFSKANFEKLIQDILNFYQNKGFPLVKVSPTLLEQKGDSITISLSIEEGPLVVIHKTIFKGLRRTKGKVLGKIFTPLLNKPYKGNILKNKIQLIKREGYRIDSIGFSKGEVGYNLVIHIKGEPQNQLKGVLSAQSGHTPMGEFSLLAENLMGTARKLNIKWVRTSLKEQSLDLLYREPWILGSGIYGELEAYYSFRETLYIREKGGILIGGSLFPVELALGLFLYRRRDLTSGGFEGGVGANLKTKTEFSWKGLELGLKSRSEFDRKKSKHILGFALGFIPISPLRINLNLSYFRLISSAPKQYDLFSLGGPEVLRGFPDGHFLATYAAILGIEISRIANTPIFLFGEVSRLSTLTSYLTPIDFGFGIEGRSLLGPVKILVAFARGRPWREGIVRISMKGAL